MQKLEVFGASQLKGQIKISGSKNASLPILAATLLSNKKILLRNLPLVRDIETMKNLLERLKPEVKLQLESNRDRYSTSVDRILVKLSSEYFYDNLSISTISSIYTFANIDLIKTSVWDIKYGDNILNEIDD